ncbi:Eco57I restriction-modification methylase domain-containing protein [Bradyrhizobium diazoefficiens]
MDKDTRNAIERATQRIRRLLQEDFAEQLDAVFDVRPDGRVAEKGGRHLSGRQLILRDRIVAAIEHKRRAGMQQADAVRDYVRDAAFTTLNRFAALKMLEPRGLVQECISRGENSIGFQEFCGLAPALKTADGAGYRFYIESIFDELSTEVKVLFDRRDPASVLWPKKSTFDEILEILNDADLQGVWKEDETIGWIYQFFNSGEERRQMREESAAPRNSRELAIRNQFFTPSYVVQFLTDNTLGRIWHKMRNGRTGLAEKCEYMVKTSDNAEESSNPAKKDPRDLRILDPACGSGHFLLYCFALLLLIYEEAWNDETSPASGVTGGPLRQDYATLDDLKKAAPGLILRHNLHGVDIDPRCAQIAQLALWMRAQRAFMDNKVPRGERPIIRRANVVIAEPMPGDPKLVEDFSASLRPAMVSGLFNEIVSEMRLAGEMGSLLPIERTLARSIDRARAAFNEQQSQTEQFLPGLAPTKRQGELDISGISNSAFFEKVEENIFSALKAFAGDAVNGKGTRRRLFADDAQQGLAFVELFGRKFDIVLMNPPFGAGSIQAKQVFERVYPRTKNDVYAAFVERGIELLSVHGMLGAITSRTGFFLSSFQKWREEILLKEAPPVVIADLGYGVLDSAMVEVAAYCLRKSAETSQ